MAHASPAVMDDAMTDEELLLEKRQAITVQARDKAGRPVVRIFGKNFPARALGRGAEAALKGYVRKRVLPALQGAAAFVVVYMHSRVDRGGNFPGVGAVRAAYESLPAGGVRDGLHAVYFLHPGIQSRLFLATFRRFLFNSGYLWAHVREGELDVPEAVRRHDDELERRTLMDCGVEATERCGMFDAASMDTTASLHSLRCVS